MDENLFHGRLQELKKESQCFLERDILNLIISGIEEFSKGSGIGVPPGNNREHDIPDKDDTGMRDQSIIGSNLEFPSQFQDRFYHLEEDLHPSAFHRG